MEVVVSDILRCINDVSNHLVLKSYDVSVALFRVSPQLYAVGPHRLQYFWVMTNLMHSFLMYLFYASACFEQQVLIIRKSKLY
jgi:hypothetical protein